MTINTNIINDLSQLTTIPTKTLQELIKYEMLCIGSAIKEALDQNEKTTILNIGIGTLSIDLQDMQCKFVPSNDLKQIIKKSINKADPLQIELEQAIKEKLLKICDEVPF